ncbi:serine carboxypeptidase [Desarmillaria tabescens]|uniref:Carboxypeptidase n=1 Tax=Armillaria tabescens TaxID=1929756 RepID=A0AA39JMM4_ARMTA|nr:serine carboxypeptidase [Desarmillaria tabescens]KAK0444660.1 serine carboxypeptidase [Desarmillaria tabescens]
MLWTTLSLICSLLLQSCAAETPLWTNGNYGTSQPQAVQSNCNSDDVTSLASLSVGCFTTLRHSLYPEHSIRIKKTSFCDQTVQAYTGYIDISQTRHLFFYFFESRNDPVRDDVVFWTNGGPGCSSSTGLFMEMGPCRVLDAHGPKYHPDSWNTNTNIFFIDQPVGTGFSYGETVSTTEDGGRDIAAFISIFFESFSQFEGRPLHMAGESYGGRFLPFFASAVYDNNALLRRNGRPPINLKSVVIGNGLTDSIKMVLSYFDMECTSVSFPPILSISTCISRCENWMQDACIDVFDSMNCGAAYSFCRAAIGTPYARTRMNPYDMSRECDGDFFETECYPMRKYISEYLSIPSVRSLLGVDPGVPENFSACNYDIINNFSASQDELHPTITKDHIAALLERGVRVLVYAGANDWLCNWVGNERWTLGLEWSGRKDFVRKRLQEWEVGGKVTGKTRSAKGLTFATIDGAGHFAPYDKPKEALVMLQRWIAGENL